MVDEVTHSILWRTYALKEDLDNQTASDYLNLVVKHTPNDATVISDYPPVLFSAYEYGTQRKIIPLSGGLHLTGLLDLPSFKERPDIVERLVRRGHPVYFIGDPKWFASACRSTESCLDLAPSARVRTSRGDLILYRVTQQTLLLLSRFASATITSPRGDVPPVQTRIVAVDHVIHAALLEHPDAVVTFDNIDVPANSRLRFATVIDPTCGTTSAGATFVVEIADGVSRSRVFARTMRPATDMRDRQWRDNQVDTSAWAGHRITISFITHAVAQDYTCAWGVWGDPAIESSDTPQPSDQG